MIVNQQITGFIVLGKTGCIPNCCFALLHVGGEDTAHGGTPRLVSPSTGDNLECSRKTYVSNNEFNFANRRYSVEAKKRK